MAEAGTDGAEPRRTRTLHRGGEEARKHAGEPLGEGSDPVAWSYLDPPGLPQLEGMLSF